MLIGVGVGFAGPIIKDIISIQSARKDQRRKEALEGLLSVHDALTEMSGLCAKFTFQAANSSVSGQYEPLGNLQISQAFGRLSYMLGIYAPDKLSEFKKIEETYGKFTRQWVDHFIAISRGNQGQDTLKALSNRMHDQMKAIEGFQEMLSKYSQEKYFKSSLFRTKT